MFCEGHFNDRLPDLTVQVTAGVGTPPTWQWKLTVCPSTALWSTGWSFQRAGTGDREGIKLSSVHPLQLLTIHVCSDGPDIYLGSLINIWLY